MERPIYLESRRATRGSDIIRVITGVRRCGKSSMLIIYKAWLEEQFGTDSVIYLNFDGPDFILDKTPRRMAEAIRNAITDSTRFLLLDEVQLMEGWENVVNAYYSTGLYELTITGSNAKMLSSELETLLTGRYAEIEMSPPPIVLRIQPVQIIAGHRTGQAIRGISAVWGISHNRPSRRTNAEDRHAEVDSRQHTPQRCPAEDKQRYEQRDAFKACGLPQ